MRNFLKFGDIDPIPALLAIQQRQNMWDESHPRQGYNGSPHKEACTIPLRYNPIDEDTKVTDVLNGIECVDYPEYDDFPEIRAMVNWLMARVNGEHLGRVMLTRLPPGGQIYSHTDKGRSFEYYKRFHIPLQSDGSRFSCGDETVIMAPGEVWWFDNQKEHSVDNENACYDRVHLIVDIRTRAAGGGHKYFPSQVKLAAPVSGGKVNFNVESFIDCMDEIKSLVDVHFEEVGLDKIDVPLDIDWDAYRRIELSGELLTVVARNEEGQMAGYCISIVGSHLHYKSSCIGMVDSFYMVPAARKGTAGIRLMKYSVGIMRDVIGVKRIHASAKIHNSVSKVLKVVGFRPIEICHSIVF